MKDFSYFYFHLNTSPKSQKNNLTACAQGLYFFSLLCTTSIFYCIF